MSFLFLDPLHFLFARHSLVVVFLVICLPFQKQVVVACVCVMDFPEAKKWISHASQCHEPAADSPSSTSLSGHTSFHDGNTPPLSQSVTPQISQPSQLPTATRMTTVESTVTRDPSFEVDWEEDETSNPRNWPTWYKGLVIFSISFSTLVVSVAPSRNHSHRKY